MADLLRYAWCALLAACLLSGCHLSTSGAGRTLLDVEADPSLRDHDRVLVLLRDAGGTDTLFDGKLDALDTLSRLPAPGFGGGRALVILQGYKDGALVYEERRDYDGSTGQADVEIVLDPTRATNSIGSLDIRPDDIRLFVRGEPLQLTAGPAADWQGKPLAWTTGDPGVATVSQTGMVSPVGPGVTYVRAAFGDSARDASSVTVVRDVPVLDAGARDTSCAAGSAIAFRVKVTQEYGVVDIFAWDLDGDGAYEDSAAGAAGQVEFTAPRRTYATSGVFPIRFRVRDGEGNVATASKSLTVGGSAPRIDSLSASPAVVTIGDPVDFAARASGSGAALAAYAWDFDGDGRDDSAGSLGGGSAAVRGGHRYPAAASYQASLRVTDAGGVSVTAKAAVLVKLDRPTAEAGPNVSAVVGSPVRLRGVAFDTLGRIVSREWKIGPAAFAASDSGAAEFTAPATPGEILCIFRVADDDGLTAVDSLKVAVNDSRGPAIESFTPSDTAVSIKDSVAFVARVKSTDADLKSFTADTDGDGTPDVQGQLSGKSADLRFDRRYLSARSHNVELRVEDVAGKAAAGQARVQVRLDPPVADAGKDTAVNAGARAYLRGQSSDGMGRVVLTEWKIGTGSFAAAPGGDTSFVAVAGAGTIPCIFRVTDDDGLATEDTMKVVVNTSSDAALKSLALTAGTLDPAFATGTTAYTAWVYHPVYATSVIAATSSPVAALSINGRAWTSGEESPPVLLEPGIGTTISVDVTAEDGRTTKSYKIAVTRRSKPVTTLASVTLNPNIPLDRTFTPGTTSYDLVIVNSVTSLTVTAAATDPTCTVKISNQAAGAIGQASAPVQLDSGSGTFAVYVTAEDGVTATTYFFSYTRESVRP